MLKSPFEIGNEPFDLQSWFDHLNGLYFGSDLPAVEIRWNSRLRSSAGRFSVTSKPKAPKDQGWQACESAFSKRKIHELLWPGRFREKDKSKPPQWGQWFKGIPRSHHHPLIEIASYLLHKPRGADLIYDTLAHEMIHYWLWWQKKPYGHTPLFYRKMKAMGVSRYNPEPKSRELKYLYGCPQCGETFPSRKRLVLRACGKCCKKENRGKYHDRFKLILIKTRPQSSKPK